MSQLNLDPTEINKFEALAASWWDPNGALKTLHDINPLRLEFIQQRALLSGKKVLDMGCGGGILSESLAQQGAQVTGLDMSPESIYAAQAHAQINGLSINYQINTAEVAAVQSPAFFDVVICMELLEHTPDPASIVKACATLVKPGGQVFFSTINRNPKAYLYAVLGAEYLLQLLPKGTHDYDKFIKPSELAAWARNNQLTAQEFMGLTYSPLTQKYNLGPDISVNYLLHCQRAS